ncbi:MULTISPECIES: hypothetical protein, partial [Rhodonellum]
MENSPVKWFFLLSLSLMIIFRVVSKLDIMPEIISGFDSNKILKVIFLGVFIFFTFIIYRKYSKKKKTM